MMPTFPRQPETTILPDARRRGQPRSVIAPRAASAAVPPGGDGCDVATLQAEAQSFGNAGTFDGNAFAQLSKALKKARKNAPNELKSSLAL